MEIEFKKFSDFERGILYNQLVDAYSFDKNCKKYWEKDWLEYDNFFYDNLRFTDDCGLIMLLDGKPIGHISWDPRNLPEHVSIGHNCILSKYKGNGYGHILLQEAIRQIQRYEGIKKLLLLLMK